MTFHRQNIKTSTDGSQKYETLRLHIQQLEDLLKTHPEADQRIREVALPLVQANRDTIKSFVESNHSDTVRLRELSDQAQRLCDDLGTTVELAEKLSKSSEEGLEKSLLLGKELEAMRNELNEPIPRTDLSFKGIMTIYWRGLKDLGNSLLSALFWVKEKGWEGWELISFIMNK